MSRNLIRYAFPMLFLAELSIFSALSPFFLRPENLLNITLQTAITGILAVGMTLVILTGGIDISVGSLVAFLGILLAYALKAWPSGAGLAGAIGMTLLVGALVGITYGLLITRFRIAPFIATLAGMAIWRGLAYVWSGARPVWGLPAGFSWLGEGRIGTLPVPSLLMLLFFLCVAVMLARTRLGRYIYAVGGNAEAARLSGIPVARILVSVYALNGILVAIATCLLVARLNSGQPTAGLMYELNVIAAVTLGGTSLQGGRGNIWGSLLGALFIGVLRNGLNLMSVDSYLQDVVLGLVILMAVLLDRRPDR